MFLWGGERGYWEKWVNTLQAIMFSFTKQTKKKLFKVVYLASRRKANCQFYWHFWRFYFEKHIMSTCQKEQRRAVFCINLATNGRTTSNVRNTFILRKGSNSKVTICSISRESIELATAKCIQSLNTVKK